MDLTEARRQWVKEVGGYAFVGRRTGVVSKRVEQWCMEGFPAKKVLQLREIANEKQLKISDRWFNFDKPLCPSDDAADRGCTA